MGQQDNNNTWENPDTRVVKVTQTDLENLKQEFKQLQDAKSRLHQEINHLEQERQQKIAKQAQLQEQLMQQLKQEQPDTQAAEYNENAHKLLALLNSTLKTTFKTLQQDLNNYQSSLSQQLSHMHSLEQQGEAILEALINRLSEQIQQESQQTPGTDSSTLSDRNQDTPHSVTQQAIGMTAPHTALPKPASRKEGLSQVQIGFIFVLLSTVALSVHNVIVRIVGSPSNVFGFFQMGGFIKLSLGNSLLILWLRMMVVVPLLAMVANRLYSPVWTDLKKVLTSANLSPLFSAVASGCSLFLSQVLIYIAFGIFGNPGIPVTILFMYPILTVPLAWLLFGDRPSQLQISAMFAVTLGVVLAAWPNISSTQNLSLLGVGTAVAAGVAFAFYLIFIQIAFQKRIPPVPASLIQFATIFVLCNLSLIFLPQDFLSLKIQANQQIGLLIGAILLGVLTLLGYLLNNFAVKYMGAAQASIVSSMGPALTAVLALLIIPSNKTVLQGVQWAGIILVTLAVGALSFERLHSRTRPPKLAR